jgi:hypothetical protein
MCVRSLDSVCSIQSVCVEDVCMCIKGECV